ncbi:Peptidase S1, PA clan,Serine proteases, trypsin domain [Cinara cedri]|uniref:Peptidase S1, PA clan,Serine proteases, trypsin domain n=1 Tax=Cinara cedri TaxID=506608 RepID=A0A5E4NP32_9HEMI|nr:Peptidase S1, PA clan,Serine proteases, trypsin domain [Cinara cedri]
MNTWLYLIFVYFMSITCNSFNLQVKNEGLEEAPIKDLTVQELTSGNYSAQETDLKDNKTNTPKLFFEKTKSILQRLPGIAKEIANAIISDIVTDESPNLPKDPPTTWRVLSNLITNLKKQIQNLKVSCSLEQGVDYFRIHVKFDSILFGTQRFEFKAARERIRTRNVPIIEEDETNDETNNEKYIKIPILPLEKNVIPITTEEEFIRGASKTYLFPYHVVITMSKSNNIDKEGKWCQGAFIKSNWIITSRSCIKEHFDINSQKFMKVFLDALDETNSKSIFYSNVLLSKHVQVGPLLLEPGPDGLDDLALLNMVTVPKDKEISVVALKLPDNYIVEEVNCLVVTRCSDGVVRGLSYKLTELESEINLEFLKPGSMIVCDNQLLSIKTNDTSFYPLISALKWIEKIIRGDNRTQDY